MAWLNPNHNQISSFNGLTVVHDADGNMTSGPLTSDSLVSYVYDSRNRLTSAGGISYGYDPEGNRISMTQSGNTTRYITSANGGLSQTLIRIRPDGSKTFYVYGQGLIYDVETTSADAETGVRRFYHSDLRGSTVSVTDGNAAVTERIEYSPYGAITRRVGVTTDTPFLFNGKFGVLTDPNGLYSMRARFYNPYICRFVNADPSGFSGGLNFYAHCDGNPISLIDPFGLGAQELSISTWVNSGRNSVSMDIPIYQEPYPGTTAGTSIRASTLYEQVADSQGYNRLSSADIPVARNPNTYSSLLIGANQLVGTPVGEQMADLNATLYGLVLSLDFAPAQSGPATEGIYEFTASSGKTYVGQTGNIPIRIQQHLTSGKLPPVNLPGVSTTEVFGGKTAREIAEQVRINELGGIKNLENIRNPIGPDRRCLLPP